MLLLTRLSRTVPLILWLVLAGPALAQSSAAGTASPSRAEVEKLVNTLENDSARKVLIGQLRLLLKAQAGGGATSAAVVDDSAAPAILSVIPDRIEESVWVALRRWGGSAAHWLSQGIGPRVIGAVISITSALALAVVVWRLVSGAINRYLTAQGRDGAAIERSRRMRTLLPLLRLVVRIVLAVLVGLTILSELGVNIAPLLAGAGVVGIAIGFGAQRLVQDVITGIFILVEDTISLGDSVSIGGFSGTVEAMSIRALNLRDIKGHLHTVPFSSVGSVTNMSKGFGQALFDVDVAYHEDVDRVIEVLQMLGADFRADPAWAGTLLDPIEVLGLERFDASSVVIRARLRTRAGDQWAVTREFNRRIKRRFDELGIDIPFPQTTVWFGQELAVRSTAGGGLPPAG